MSLIVMKDQLQRNLDAFLVGVGGAYTYHLYQNNVSIVSGTTVLTDFVEATFSGYGTGLVVGSWNASTWVDPRAIADAAPLYWTHNGGATSNLIYGYFVTDGGGLLAWAEVNPSGPITINAAGQTYAVIPRYSRRSEF